MSKLQYNINWNIWILKVSNTSIYKLGLQKNQYDNNKRVIILGTTQVLYKFNSKLRHIISIDPESAWTIPQLVVSISSVDLFSNIVHMQQSSLQFVNDNQFCRSNSIYHMVKHVNHNELNHIICSLTAYRVFLPIHIELRQLLSLDSRQRLLPTKKCQQMSKLIAKCRCRRSPTLANYHDLRHAIQIHDAYIAKEEMWYTMVMSLNEAETRNIL